MEIRVLEKTEDKVSFILKNSTPAFANMIRRNIIENTPTMAIEDVEFRKNSSILYDEIIAHRLGLIPLKTDLELYYLPEKCKCGGKGCNRCTLKMTLKAKGPATVYASDIKSNDPKIKPVYPKTPIVKLLKGQDIELEATAMLGKGKDHIKWSPALVYYKYKPVVEIIKEPANQEEIVKSCPLHVYEIKNNKLIVNKDSLLKCHLCGACVDASNNTIKVIGKEDEFVFYVESWGQLSCEDIIKTSLDIFQEQLSDFVKAIEKA